MLPTGCLRAPTSHISPHFHAPPTRSSSGKIEHNNLVNFKPTSATKGKFMDSVWPQNRRSSFSRCRWWHQSWQRQDSSHKETTPLSSQCAGVHPGGQSYMSRSHLKKTVRWTIECSHFEIKMRVTVKILVSLFNTLFLRIWQIRRFV